MTGLNFLFWVIGIIIALLVASIIGLIAWALFKVKRSKPKLNDLLEETKIKHEELLNQNQRQR